MDLKEKVCIITGASSGIGEACCRALLDDGACVVATARREDRLNEVVEGRPKALAVPADLTELAQHQTVIEKTVETFGRIDVLINNAGTFFGGALEDFSPEEAEYEIRLNLVAPIWMTQLAMPHLLQQKRGLIVNISSVGALVPVPNQSVYCASKIGLVGFSLALRRELKQSNVSIVNVYPGVVSSEMHTKETLEKTKELAGKLTSPPLTPEEAAALILEGIKQDKDEIYAARRPDKLMALLNKWAPRMVDAKLASVSPTIREIMVLVNEHSRARNAPKTPK